MLNTFKSVGATLIVYFWTLAETMLERRKQLFFKDGEVNREGLIEFYKDLRKYPDLSDSDAAILAATKYELSCNRKG